MNRDEITRMAREARLVPEGLELCPKDEKALERFVALVAAAKDAEHQQTLALQQRSYEREIQLEVEAEREACAKVCDGYADNKSHPMNFSINCADAIRARGNT